MKFKEFKNTLSILGMLLFTEGIFMLFCIPFALYYKEDFKPMLYAGIVTIISGLVLSGFRSWGPREHVDKRIAFLIVSLSWIIISCFGALPYLFSNVLDSFSNAFFESMSGFTTTGSSVIENIELTPKSIILWRSLSQWIGGMGIVVLVVAIIPFLGINSMSLYSAEVPGPSKEKLHPRILTSARRLWNTYCIVTLMVIILLMLGGMNFYESLNHTFSAVSTGGFSIKKDSVAGYSPYIQYVLIFAMVISSFNYSLNYYLLKGNFKKLFESEELRTFLTMILIAGICMSVGLIVTTNMSIEESIRHGLFQVSSIVSTTGFVSADYNSWATPLLFLFIVLMLCGGMAGSTSGGLKTIRIILLFKNYKQVLRNIVHSRALLPIKVDGKAVQDNIIQNVLAFFLIYILTFVVASLIMMLFGINMHEAMSSIAACISSYGPGFGKSGGFGNFNHFPDICKWVLSIVMFLGRLEFVTVLIIFFPPFWKR